MLLATAAAVLLAWPQNPASVRASLTAASIAVGETTVLAIEVATGGAAPDEIPVPLLPPGLDLGPISDFSQQQVSFPGGRRRVTRREIAIIAMAPGSYRIPPVEIRVADTRIRTRELLLVVTRGHPGAGAAGGIPLVRLRGWATPDVAFVGQQVLYQVEAVFPDELRLRLPRPPSFEPPEAAGFWSYDLPEPVAVSLRLSAGAAAEVQQYRRVLFPLAEGRLVIPPARMQYELRQGIAYTSQLRSLATEPVAIQVLPLPAGAPSAFAGAIGSYTVAAALSALEASPGEPVTLSVTVEGRGNLKALARPALDTIAGFDVYPGAERLELGYGTGGVSGRKRFEWTLVPRSAGDSPVPGVQYAWFDPDARAYRVARTPSMQLAVRLTAANPAADGELAPLRTDPSHPILNWAIGPAFVAAQLIPPLALLGLWLGKRNRRRRAAERRARDPVELRRAAALRCEPRACLEQLAIWLGRAPVAPGSAELLQRVRQALYSPVTPSSADCDELLRAAHSLAARSPSGHRSGRGPFLWLALILLTATGIGAAAPATDSFGKGVAAYHAGRYEEATKHFATHLAGTPLDGATWYDLGNAAFRAGDPGQASWAWLKALQLLPRDRWARRNLRAAGARQAVLALAPRVPLASSEAAVLAAALWWLAAACLGLAIASSRWRRPAATSALAAAVLLLPLAALLVGRHVRPDHGITITPTSLQAAPSLRADPLRTLEAGEPLRLLDRRAAWLLVRSGDLREGWVEETSVGVL
jgi:tetratricopeptide (TPR) repeat protein